MPDKLKVEGRPELVRDTRTGAILNVDTAAFQGYKAAKSAKQTQKNLLEQTVQDVATLKSDVSEIKNMLALLINSKV